MSNFSAFLSIFSVSSARTWLSSPLSSREILSISEGSKPMWAHLDNEEQKQDLHIYFMLLPLPADRCAEFCHKRKAKLQSLSTFLKRSGRIFSLKYGQP